MDNIIENNKLIAKFMGLNKTKMFFNLKTGNYVKKETADCDIKVVDVYLKNNKPITNFYYHSDWNWLMEVVEKCLVGEAEYNEDEAKKAIREIYESLCNINISSVYNACVKFIKWYNENKSK